MQHLVINCGAPDANRTAARQAARMTAAHSTLTLDDTSSCRFNFQTDPNQSLDQTILSGPDKITFERTELPTASKLRISHNGYQSRFGLIHERDLILAKDGAKLEGQDRLTTPSASKLFEILPYSIRFHIHPSVRLTLSSESREILCELPDATRWVFSSPEANIQIAESVFLAAPDGPRRCEQIVISASTGDTVRVDWSFQRLDPTAVT
jgi:uncharacterized heparinase superfamily protein